MSLRQTFSTVSIPDFRASGACRLSGFLLPAQFASAFANGRICIADEGESCFQRHLTDKRQIVSYFDGAGSEVVIRAFGDPFVQCSFA